jgi:hypothetical protein
MNSDGYLLAEALVDKRRQAAGSQEFSGLNRR